MRRPTRLDRMRARGQRAAGLPTGAPQQSFAGGYTPTTILSKLGGAPNTLTGETGQLGTPTDTYNPVDTPVPTPQPEYAQEQPAPIYDYNTTPGDVQEQVMGTAPGGFGGGGFELTSLGGGVFKEGGMVGKGGQRIPAQQLGAGSKAPAQSAQMPPEAMQAQIRDAMISNPQVSQQVQQAVQQAMATGELTPQELDMAVKLAQVAIADPNTWPRVRAFAIAQGIAEEEDIPQEYDAGLVYALLAVGEAMGAGQQMEQPGMPQTPGAAPPGQDQGAVPITAHEGEYVIPQHVVAMKGKEFFDKLVNQYAQQPPK